MIDLSFKPWFLVEETEKIDSPALLVYPDRIADNIQAMIRIAGHADRLIPHVKTHKMASIVKMQLEAGIRQFKCATIAEAEMLAEAGASFILLAYPLTLPKAKRFAALAEHFREIRFCALVDNLDSGKMLNDIFDTGNQRLEVLVDIDNGMHRTGHQINELLWELWASLSHLPNLDLRGFHVYDGHIRNPDFLLRTRTVMEAMSPLKALAAKIRSAGYPDPRIIAGGTPSFTVHALDPSLFCSPGTCLLWDEGYDQLLTEQDFSFAAVVLARVISKPEAGRITLDLGHKSVASENPMDQRVSFLNLDHYRVVGQSEEHLVVEVSKAAEVPIGSAFYVVPYHICPTVALYDEALVIRDHQVVDHWPILARKRKIVF
ncbi:MAG: D-TA family PLP-dependent enzyme [Chitinophagaceae bacterium]